MKAALTSNLHNVSRHNFFGFDPLDGLPVLTVHLANLWLVLLKGFNGTFCITFLRRRESNVKKADCIHLQIQHLSLGWDFLLDMRETCLITFIIFRNCAEITRFPYNYSKFITLFMLY